ncbi:MAG: MOSC domain-containing protein [Sphingomonas sp.]|uniref:MOSC domain-containing protein n=1 Tax=Sphingomonas sp. TaxID=28214 RepID=UPI0025D9667D|nr:MOSC domain-containing protein [Sphingomonas sp.]MBY0283635.1 MOSC domain-containing protein [Sphingomonas sp.]
MTVIATLQSLQLGKIAPIGPEGVPSGIVKHPVAGPVELRGHRLVGDETADLTVHGGPDKAVYGYSADLYPVWAAERPAHAARLTPGVFGENLTIAGINEADLCIGDIHAIGTARLQICQPRQPCFKFALRFEDATMPKAMVRSGRSGWYYRTIEEGVLEAGDEVSLVERPHPELAFERMVEIVNFGQATEAELALMAESDGLAVWLRSRARAALRD